MPFKVEIYKARKRLLIGRTQWRARTRSLANGKIGFVTGESYNNIADLEAVVNTHFPGAVKEYLL
jgi:hypothetical protein